MANLTEGMRPGDLEDLVLPMITVDEYESKLDDNAIVIGFYVSDRDAAEDLNRYIQKSPVQLLDTEVSPAPDQHGYYIVFIELLNDRQIVDNIKAILEEVSPLSSTDEWQMRLRGADGVTPFSAKILSKTFAQVRADLDSSSSDDADVTGDETEGRVMEFFTTSDLSNALIEDRHLTLVGHNGQFTAEFVGIGAVDTLLSKHGLIESAISLHFGDITESLRLTHLLGEGWVSQRIGDHSVLQRVGTESAILLRNTRFI